MNQVNRVARIYMRVSTNSQDLARQENLIVVARNEGFYVAGVYRETASGARADRPELLRLIADLQPGDVVVAERLDRISRLPLPAAEKLIASIRERGGRLSVPGVVDLSDLVADADGTAKIVLEAVQELLLRLALQMARDEYEVRRERQRQGVALAKQAGRYRGRQADTVMHARILSLRQTHSIRMTAALAGCSISQVKRICKLQQKRKVLDECWNLHSHNVSTGIINSDDSTIKSAMDKNGHLTYWQYAGVKNQLFSKTGVIADVDPENVNTRAEARSLLQDEVKKLNKTIDEKERN